MSYAAIYGGTDVADYAQRLDEIQRLYTDGDIEEAEMIELTADLKNELEINEAVMEVKLKGDLLKTMSVLAKLI
jgi:hypothetical protein